MRGRSYSYSPSPPRSYGRRYRSPSPRGRGARRRDLPTSLLVRNLRHDCRFVTVIYTLWLFHLLGLLFMQLCVGSSHLITSIGCMLRKMLGNAVVENTKGKRRLFLRSFCIELINFFIGTCFAGQRTYVDYLGGLVLLRTFTCHEIIILGRLLLKIVILICMHLVCMHVWMFFLDV